MHWQMKSQSTLIKIFQPHLQKLCCLEEPEKCLIQTVVAVSLHSLALRHSFTSVYYARDVKIVSDGFLNHEIVDFRTPHTLINWSDSLFLHTFQNIHFVLE